MNLRKGTFLAVLFFMSSQLLFAQQTTVFTEANSAYKRGIDLFNQGVYGLAQTEFKLAMDLLRPVNEPEWTEVKTDAALYFAKCAVRLDQPDAEVQVVDLLRDQAPSPVASQAALEIGDYYFDNRKYDKALEYYEMAQAPSGALRDEITFKRGYSYFVTKKFPQAKTLFARVKENVRGEYYYPANYYFGCCSFFEKRYDEAVRAFTRCENSPLYKRYIPHYLTEIYFARGQYDQVIAYGAPKAQQGDLRNREEINQLVGRAYFEKKDYNKALPYLEYAAENGAAMYSRDFYQLGYAQYQNGYYKQAIENLEELTKQDSLLGQNGLYHLGDCYLRTNNKFAARNAFGQAASLNYDPSVKEDALFNYAKLSYELNYDRAALSALQQIKIGSPYYNEAQNLMGEIFLNTRDYDRAIATLESFPNRNQKLNEAYQQVCYLRGIQLYDNNQKGEARRYFNKSLDFPIDKKTAALCSFWMGTIANEEEEYSISRAHMASFLTQANNYRDLPEESSIMMGQYVQGYNYLKLKDYDKALSNFTASVDGLKRNRNSIQSNQIKDAVLGDAILRAGDCNFKKNKYSNAIKYYDEAITRKADGFEYALYQKAIIRGLQGSPFDKVVALEELINKYPNSRYTDEALYQLGITYQEMGKFSQAVTPLKKLISDYRGRSNLINSALLRLGLISYNQGNTSAAINYYKQVFSNNPENSEAKDALAALEEIYVKELNRPNEYFQFLETVPGYDVSTASRDSVTYKSAEIQFDNGRYQQAIQGYTNYLATYPRGRYVLPAYYQRAESYASSTISQYDKALTDYEEVLGRGLSSYYPKAAEKAANIAFFLKDYNKGMEYSRKWEESALSDQSRLQAQVKILEAAYLTQNTASVNEYGRKVSSSMIASSDQVSRANYYLGKTAYEQNNYTVANTYLRNVVNATESEMMAESHHLLAQILYKQRRYDEAESYVSEANKASAGYDNWIARNLILLSDVYVALNDKNSASAALEVVLENYRGDDVTILPEARQKYNQINGGGSTTPPPGSRGIDLLDLDEGN
jgi:tetratricopeptide (TPR) repeat protein